MILPAGVWGLAAPQYKGPTYKGPLPTLHRGMLKSPMYPGPPDPAQINFQACLRIRPYLLPPVKFVCQSRKRQPATCQPIREVSSNNNGMYTAP